MAVLGRVEGNVGGAAVLSGLLGLPAVELLRERAPQRALDIPAKHTAAHGGTRRRGGAKAG